MEIPRRFEFVAFMMLAASVLGCGDKTYIDSTCYADGSLIPEPCQIVRQEKNDGTCIEWRRARVRANTFTQSTPKHEIDCETHEPISSSSSSLQASSSE